MSDTIKNIYGTCTCCGAPLYPVFFTEKERKVVDGIMIETGRVRRACSHLACNFCPREYAVDDTFDGPWR